MERANCAWSLGSLVQQRAAWETAEQEKRRGSEVCSGSYLGTVFRSTYCGTGLVVEDPDLIPISSSTANDEMKIYQLAGLREVGMYPVDIGRLRQAAGPWLLQTRRGPCSHPAISWETRRVGPSLKGATLPLSPNSALKAPNLPATRGLPAPQSQPPR